MSKYIIIETDEYGDIEDYNVKSDLECTHLVPNSKFLLDIIKIPSGYKVIPDHERQGVKPDGYLFLDNGKWLPGCGSKCFWPGGMYIAPIKSQKDIKKEKLQRELKDIEDKAKRIRKEMGEL